jgi:hypothetical protein
MKHILQSGRQFLDTVAKKMGRFFLHLRMRNASEPEVLAAERKMRGVEQLDKLQRADIVIVSFGKSGRTWLRVMISHLFRVMYKLPENALLGFDNFHGMNRSIPKIFFTHDNYIKDLTGDHSSKTPFYGKRVVLLARDPRDVAVSQFFQWKFRMKPHKSAINNYPLAGSDTSILDFVTGEGGGGIHAIAEYMNLWAQESPKVENFHLLRYESLRANPHEELAKLLEFMQVTATQENIDQAVDYSSYENMKKMESKQQFRLAGGRMMPGDKNNPDSFKVRRAKIGGYRDYFEDNEVAAIDAQLADQLDAYFGYR